LITILHCPVFAVSWTDCYLLVRGIVWQKWWCHTLVDTLLSSLHSCGLSTQSTSYNCNTRAYCRLNVLV